MSYGIIASAVAGALFVAYITPKHEIRIVHPAAAQVAAPVQAQPVKQPEPVKATPAVKHAPKAKAKPRRKIKTVKRESGTIRYIVFVPSSACTCGI